jgi:ABC-2 type transport system ATP-binding protein
MTTAPVAELVTVTKRFGHVVALDGLSLDVRRGELLAVLGPNGAGKTTAIALLLGLQRPAAGVVRLFGHAPGIATRRRLGVMMQDVSLAPELRVGEHIALVASYYASPLRWPCAAGPNCSFVTSRPSASMSRCARSSGKP